jgi:hypothetical protein
MYDLHLLTCNLSGCTGCVIKEKETADFSFGALIKNARKAKWKYNDF